MIGFVLGDWNVKTVEFLHVVIVTISYGHFQFTVIVSDGRGKTAQSLCTVDVTRNEEHPYFVGAPYSHSIDYDQAANDVFFRATASDNDKQVCLL